jgi:hypothetical protein
MPKVNKRMVLTTVTISNSKKRTDSWGPNLWPRMHECTMLAYEPNSIFLFHHKSTLPNWRRKKYRFTHDIARLLQGGYINIIFKVLLTSSKQCRIVEIIQSTKVHWTTVGTAFSDMSYFSRLYSNIIWITNY